MKLVDIIKTKNGLNYLGSIQEDFVYSMRYVTNKMNHELPYDENVTYPETDFSYKNAARKFRKIYDESFRNTVTELHRETQGDSQKMLHTLKTQEIQFDGDFIAFENELVTYMQYNKEQRYKEDGGYMKTGRQSLTIHKFLAKVFKGTDYAEASIKSLAELIVAKLGATLSVVFLKGEDIGNSYYNVSHVGWSTSSCMANKKEYPPKRFTIYNENCELGVIMDGDEPVARFLVWIMDDGTRFEDRLYYKTYAVQEWYKNRVKAEKILNYSTCYNEINDVVVTLARPYSSYKDDERPSYLDTIRFPSKNGKRLGYNTPKE